MTEQMIERLLDAIRRVIAETGFGEVAVVIEHGRARRLKITVEPWIEERAVISTGQRLVRTE